MLQMIQRTGAFELEPVFDPEGSTNETFDWTKWIEYESYKRYVLTKKEKYNC